MGKVNYSLVLSDELLSEYYKFTSNSIFDRNCNEAEKFIIVYDKYFSEKDENAYTLINLIPNRKLEIIYQLNTLSNNQKDKLQKACPTWTLRDDKFQDSHDRYLIIDNKVEIILTSGFWYLNNISKEITYIVRLIKNSRFNNIKL